MLSLDGDVCRDIRIGLTNVAPMAIRAEAAEDLLRGQVITEALIEQAAEQVMAACEPAEDLRGDIEYKTHMAAEMARRSIREALARARS
jgi:carbon-monoxide dehydrogenase medium subunit